MALTIQSLERGLDILTVIGKSGSPLSLVEIAEQFTIDKSSVFRLIKTLEGKGFVTQDKETKKYTLGHRVLELSGYFSESNAIERLIRPILKSVALRTHQNTHLAVIERQEVVFIAVEQPRDKVTLNLAVGTREPAGVTALGKALMAFQAEEETRALVAAMEFKQYTDRTIIGAKEMLIELDRVRKERVAYDREEYKTGIACIASPVMDHRRRAIYSIGISGPKELIIPHLDDYGAIVKQAGQEASLLMGYTE